jgi:hypothetical protein
MQIAKCKMQIGPPQFEIFNLQFAIWLRLRGWILAKPRPSGRGYC